jgi:SPOR domain
MRGAWVALTLPIGLSGCFLPPGLAVASYAADGASYAVSDKSISDHGISTVTDQDCATWHAIVGRAVCEDPNHPVPMASLDDRGGNRQEVLNVPRPQAKPVIAVAKTSAPAPAAAALADRGPARAVPQTGAHYLIIGSFADRRRAERLAEAYAVYRAQVIEVTQNGREMSRVVLGPLDEREVAALRGRSVPGYLAQTPHPGADLIATRAGGPAG